MPSGPSKEQLEIYWKSSRQYFDELAKHYQTADPEYYRDYILPFYNNPFHASPNKRGSGGVKIFAVMALLAVLGVGAAAFFVLLRTDTDEPKIKERRVESTDDVKEKSKENSKSTDTEEKEDKTPSNEKDSDGFTPEDHFIIGSKAIADKDYDKAEKHFRRIKPGQKHYKEAQQLLENMDILRKFDK